MNSDFLYELLPLFHRRRDLDEGQPLRALMAVLQSEFDAIHEDIGQLYDNWFIETCDDWVIPYLADLVGVRGLERETHAFWGARRFVANAIGYRRAKGTVHVLNSVLEDVTGWDVRVVEFLGLVSATQSVKHSQRHGARTASLRSSPGAETADGPFNTDARTVDIRSINASARAAGTPLELEPGRFQAVNVGIYCWRVQSYPVDRATPGDAAGKHSATTRYTFHPFGIDTPLFNAPLTRMTETAPRLEINLSVPLTIELLRHDPAFSQNPPFRIFAQGPAGPAIAPQDIAFGDLEHWQFSFAETKELAVVDPIRGRFLLAPGTHSEDVRVSYTYGFPADFGGGVYGMGSDTSAMTQVPDTLKRLSPLVVFSDQPRKVRVAAPLKSAPTRKRETCRLTVFDGLGIRGHLTIGSDAAVVVRIPDSSTRQSPVIHFSDEPQTLRIEAARGTRPCLEGDLVVTCNSSPGSQLTLDNLWIRGRVIVNGNVNLIVNHCTIWPEGGPSIEARKASGASTPESFRCEISHSIMGPIHWPAEGGGIAVADSIVDGRGGAAIGGAESPPAEKGNDENAAGPTASIDRTTLFGPSYFNELSASDVLFDGPVKVRWPDAGYVRFSWVPNGSLTPLRYQCYPEHGNETRRPVFTSRRFGDPGYGQLSELTPLWIRKGAEDGSEIGVFHELYEQECLGRLRSALDEFLPYGLQAGVIFIT